MLRKFGNSLYLEHKSKIRFNEIYKIIQNLNRHITNTCSLSLNNIAIYYVNILIDFL